MRNHNLKGGFKFMSSIADLLQPIFLVKMVKSHHVEITNKTEMANQEAVPYEVLGLLVNCIPNHVDHLNFKAVCKLWHYVESNHPAPPAELPWLMIKSCDGEHKFYEICSRKYYDNPIPKVDISAKLHGSYCDGWMLCYADPPTRFFLSNVYSGEKRNLPQKTYICSDPNPFEVCTSETCESVTTNGVTITKSVFSCSPSSKDYLMASISSRGCFLTIFRLNSDDSTATTVHFGGKGLAAIIFYNNILMGVDRSQVVYSFVIEDNESGLAQVTNFQKHKMKKFDFPLPTFSNRQPNKSLTMSYLVEMSGKLLMILRYYGDSGSNLDTYTVGFKIYELIWKCPMEWVEVKSLQGHAIFLDANISRVFRTSQFPGVKDDHIYFTSSSSLFDTGVFSMTNQRTNCILPPEDFSIHSTPIWLFPPNCHVGPTNTMVDEKSSS